MVCVDIINNDTGETIAILHMDEQDVPSVGDMLTLAAKYGSPNVIVKEVNWFRCETSTTVEIRVIFK